METIEAVKATANEQVPYNVQGYLDEFSRSLATEVRMLLSEVGKLREDKRNLELWEPFSFYQVFLADYLWSIAKLESFSPSRPSTVLRDSLILHGEYLVA